MKKAQGISIRVIVVAAIALLVLIVLIAIFGGRMGLFNQGLEETTGKIPCPTTQQVAISQSCPTNTVMGIGNYDVSTGNKCCIPKASTQ